MAARSGFLRRMLSIPGIAAPHARMFSVKRSVGEDREVFVTGLSKHTSSDGLRAAFENFRKVVRAEVVTDPATGFNEGIGFVRFTRVAAAMKAIQNMRRGKLLDGWLIFAEPASLPIEEAYGSSGCRR